MSDLVRVRVGDVEFNVGAAYAKSEGLTVLDESAYDAVGTPREATRKDGRPVKKKTSVAEAAARKAATSAEPTDNAPSQEKE